MEQGGKLKFVPHAESHRAVGEHYARTISFVRGGVLRKFWAAEIGGWSSSLGIRRVSGAHPGGFREAPHKQKSGPNAALRGS